MIKIHNNDGDGLIIIIWDNPNIYCAINSSQTPFYGTIKSISGLSNQNTIYRHIYFLAINNLFICGHLVSSGSYELKVPHFFLISKCFAENRVKMAFLKMFSEN